MKKLLMGQETEYAMVAVSRSGKLMSTSTAVEKLLDHARKNLIHLPAYQAGGIFIANSSQIYVDTGNHLEVASPEVTNPWDIVRYQRAADRILANLTEQLPHADPNISRVDLYRSNVDYANGSDATWGCHESYLYQRNPRELRVPLMAFLVSRIIFSGSGGWDSLATGLEFTISPRVSHLTCDFNSSSTQDRPIFHTKNESHARDGYHRLHLICGESVCSETSAILKAGTTALVVAMLDAGIRPAKLPRLVEPRPAMRRFANDPSLKTKVLTKDCESLSAIQIQRRYLEAVENIVDLAIVPPWAGIICRLWRDTLDRLEQGGADGLSGTLDWAIKLALFKARTNRSDVRWDQLPLWNRIMRDLCRDLEQKKIKVEETTVEQVIGPRSPIRRTIRRLTPYLKYHNLGWEGLRSFVDLRQVLFELDTRYSQLGRDGIFALLEQSGALDHHVDGVDNIEHAEQFPPASGRASVRGRLIRQLHQTPGTFCDWSVIVMHDDARLINLTDPFCTEELWEDCPDNPERGLDDHPSPMLRQLIRNRWLERRLGSLQGRVERVRETVRRNP